MSWFWLLYLVPSHRTYIKKQKFLPAVFSGDEVCLMGNEETGLYGSFLISDSSQVQHWWIYHRTGIAYISNVAVRERFRRKGIAKKLIAKAEAQARSWGCRAIALHCDLNNPGASKLYKGQGFRCIKVPAGANWPQPKTSPDVMFCFMMKLLNT